MTLHKNGWQQSNFQEFWDQVAPASHILQIYESERAFLNTLEGFVGNGFLTGDAVVVIARKAYLGHIKKRLYDQGFDLQRLTKTGQYTAIDAEQLLEKFVANGVPDEALFNELVGSLLKKTKKTRRRIRAFGEMVSMLCKEGHFDAAKKLEGMWNELIEREKFCLFCAYSSHDLAGSNGHRHDICSAHSHLISGEESAPTDILHATL